MDKDLDKKIDSLIEFKNQTFIENMQKAVIKGEKAGTTISTPFSGNPDRYLIIEVGGRRYLLPAYDLQ